MQNLNSFKTLKTNFEKNVLTIELNREDVRNAFNEVLIDELLNLFLAIENKKEIRIVVLKGTGKIFCAGGDLNWRKRSITLTGEENIADTKKLTKMFDTLNSSSKPLIGLVHGAAIGGGVGLVSVCDYVIAEKNTVFSLSEVKLGIIPACIGPFVLAKIGESHARALFLSAERFDAKKAKEIGLIHEIVENLEELETAGKKLVSNLLQCGPNAIKAAKQLIQGLKQNIDHQSKLDFAATILANLRVTEEGQEGIKAFLEKRKPNWYKGE